MARFRYDPAVLKRFPAVVGGVIHATGITNGPTPPDLAAAFDAESIAVRARIGTTPLSELPALAAWRRVFRGFGVDPTQYRSAAEALLRRLTKQGELSSIGTLVDLANLVSIRHALPVAVFDLGGISGATIVRFARGDERWTDLGSSATEHPEPGEVIFVDEADVVSARRWCWRQSASSAVRLHTTEILVTVEGHHETASDDVAEALGDLESLLGTYAAAATIRGDPERPLSEFRVVGRERRAGATPMIEPPALRSPRPTDARAAAELHYRSWIAKTDRWWDAESGPQGRSPRRDGEGDGCGSGVRRLSWSRRRSSPRAVVEAGTRAAAGVAAPARAPRSSTSGHRP